MPNKFHKLRSGLSIHKGQILLCEHPKPELRSAQWCIVEIRCVGLHEGVIIDYELQNTSSCTVRLLGSSNTDFIVSGDYQMVQYEELERAHVTQVDHNLAWSIIEVRAGSLPNDTNWESFIRERKLEEDE